MEGLVTLLEANRPTVQCADGSRYLCYLKGRIKRDVGRIIVGDRVVIEPTDPGEARIESVLPRTNTLLRPPVSNVGGILAVFSLVQAKGSLERLDRRLVAARLSGLAAEIVITKVDLIQNTDDENRFFAVQEAYRRASYPVWPVVSLSGRGIPELSDAPHEGIWVLTGESGSGKSTLLNTLIVGGQAHTQSLGRTGRGQQTTRWVRLYPFGGGWLADSPGYTALESRGEKPRDIVEAFREFEEFPCRFDDCLHGSEPDCGVVEALIQGQLADWRYHHYRKLLVEWVHTY